jgi:hypothetical protein
MQPFRKESLMFNQFIFVKLALHNLNIVFWDFMKRMGNIYANSIKTIT